MTDEQLTPEQHLEITRRVFTETLRYQRDTINALESNLTATQDRCTELLNESRGLRKTLELCKERVAAELDRGYVLTTEPGAGPSWRWRWNTLLGLIEATLEKRGA